MDDPLHSLVVSIGTIKAGTQFNIITDTAVMSGTVRTHSPEARALVEPTMRQIVQGTAQALGCTAEVEYNYLEPPVINADTALNTIARTAAAKVCGQENVRSCTPAMGSEDFSYLMEKIPSSLFAFLGCWDEEEGCVHPVHNEKFRINEEILPLGAAQYAQFAADYLEQSAGGEA